MGEGYARGPVYERNARIEIADKGFLIDAVAVAKRITV